MLQEGAAQVGPARGSGADERQARGALQPARSGGGAAELQGSSPCRLPPRSVAARFEGSSPWWGLRGDVAAAHAAAEEAGGG